MIGSTKLRRISIAFLAAALLLCFQAVGFAESQMITVTGKAAIQNGNKQSARNAAIRDAMRQAVEKGIGVWIRSNTEVENAELKRDEILSHAEGYVTNSEVIQESVEDGVYTVVLQAGVSVDLIGTKLKTVVGQVKTQMGRPTVAFVLGTYCFDQKTPDMMIIDSFQQEFKTAGFDLKATDKAREIALSNSSVFSGLNIKDRKAVRDAAEKDGVNFVARGEVNIIDQRLSATGNQQVTVKIGVEIIDVNSADVVAAYSDTVTAMNVSASEAQAQAIKKASTVAARTLAGQTIDTWQDRALNGQRYTIELRNFTSIRKQKLPFLEAVRSVAEITSQTSPGEGVLLLDVLYKGKKGELGESILSSIGNQPGFSESEFDGPADEGGKIVFLFK